MNILAMTLQMRNNTAATMNNLKSSIKSTGVAANSFGTIFGKSVKATHTSVGSLIGAMFNLKAIIIAAFAYKAVAGFASALNNFIKEANDAQKSVILLGNNLAAAGNYTKVSTNALISYAETLQYVSGIQDDVIIKSMSALATYNLEASKIKELTPLIIDFAKAKGIDLATAFELVGKASQGYMGRLATYGIVVDATASKEEKYAQLLKKIASFSGTAAALTGSYEGQVSILAISYNNLKQKMGGVLQDGVRSSGILTVLANVVSVASSIIDKYGAVIADVVAGALRAFGDTLLWIGNIISNDYTIRFFVALTQVIKSVYFIGKATFVSIATGIGLLSDALSVLIAKGVQFWQWIFGSKEEYNIAKETADTVVADFWSNLDKRSQEYTSSMSNMSLSLENAGKTFEQMFSDEGFNEWKGVMDQRNAALKAAQDIERAASMQQITNGEKVIEKSKNILQLTKSIAEQFGLASRLEQEQTKAMLKRLGNMTPEQAGSLSNQEKELINKQGILKEAFTNIFSEYAEKSLGVKAKETDFKGKIVIQLTPEASKIFQAYGEADKQYRNVQYETAS